MKKRLLALGLTLALTLTPALAAGVEEKFPATKEYPGYADVPAGAWFEAGAKLCYETGLITGSAVGFEPERNMQVAEVAAIAARMGEVLTGKAIPASTPGLPWYQQYLDYLKGFGLAEVGDPSANATRGQFIAMLSAVVPKELLAPINTITALPDSTDAAVLTFCNAGILTGTDKYGTFAAGNPLTRQEGAAMVARVVRENLRKTFVPQVKAPAAAYSLPGVKGTDLAFTGKDTSVTVNDFLAAYVDAVNALHTICNEQGVAFDWNLTFDTGETFPDACLRTATSACLDALWETVDHSPYTADLLGAKHILVATQMEANDLRAQLKAAGDNETLFDELMNKRSTDGGLKTAPNGYVFGPGEMISEFENGTKALAIGQISEPIASKFGYHIIFRFQPTAEQLESAAYTKWFTLQDFRYTDAIMSADLPAFYDNYTADLK